MKVLVDESLQHELARLLNEAGHDAVHVADLGLRGAPDDEVLATGASSGRVLITADTDFGTLLALSNASGPSVVLLRGPGRRVVDRLPVILAVLQSVDAQLGLGAVVTVERSRLRVRDLPIHPQD